MFTVGDKVICVDGKFDEAFKALAGSTPVEGGVYTIRWIGTHPNATGVGVHLNEIVAAPYGPDFEYGFKVHRFRPLVSRPTSIEVFTRMLTPAPKVDA